MYLSMQVNKAKNKCRFAVILLLALSTGCSMRQHNEEGCVSISCSSLIGCSTLESKVKELSFDDPLLHCLLEKAAEDNLDLAVASLQVSEAQVSQERGWGIEFFNAGALQRINKAHLLAAQAAYEGVWGRVAGDLAKSYVSLRGNQQLLSTLKNNLTKQKEALLLTTGLVDTGFADSIAREQGLLQLEQMRGQKPILVAAIDAAAQHIAALAADQSEMLLNRLYSAAKLPELPENCLIEFAAADVDSSLSCRHDVQQAQKELLIAREVASIAHTALFYSRKEKKIKEIKALSARYNYENVVAKAREEINNRWAAYHSQEAQNVALARAEQAACAASTQSGAVIRSGLSWAWSNSFLSRGLPLKVRKIMRKA